MENNSPQSPIAAKHEPDAKTTMQVRYATIDKLTSLKRGNDTYDDVINRLIDGNHA